MILTLAILLLSECLLWVKNGIRRPRRRTACARPVYVGKRTTAGGRSAAFSMRAGSNGAAEPQARPLSRRHRRFDPLHGARSDSERGRDFADGGVADPSSCDAGSTALTHAGFRGRAACRSAEGRATGARDQLAAMCAATALQAGLERTSRFARI